MASSLAKKGWKPADLARFSGVPAKRISDYLKGPKVAGAEYLFPIADQLDVSAEWLALGREAPHRPNPLRVADDVDWEWIPRFDLRELSDVGKGEAIDRTPFRRDWLATTLGTSVELWLAAILSDYPAHDLFEGDLVFCREAEPVELLDGQLILWRINQGLTIARYSVRAGVGGTGPNGESLVTISEVSPEQYVPVARILGKLVKRL